MMKMEEWWQGSWWGSEELFHAKGWSITAWLSAGQHGRWRCITLRSFEGSRRSSPQRLFAPFAFPHPRKKKQSSRLKNPTIWQLFIINFQIWLKETLIMTQDCSCVWKIPNSWLSSLAEFRVNQRSVEKTESPFKCSQILAALTLTLTVQ